MQNSANTESGSLTSPQQQSSFGSSSRGMDSSKSITTALHAVYVFIIGLLTTLVGMKYYGTGTNPFITHSQTMLLFILASFFYTIAVLAEVMFGVADDDNSFNLFRYMYLISGSFACEVLCFVLASPFGLLLLNLSALLLIELLRRFNQQIQTFLHQIATTARQHITAGTTTITEDLEVGQVQMTTVHQP